MDPAQTKALSALQPFIQHVLTTTSPTPRFLADIISRATSAQGTYIFSELLQLEPIQSLRSSGEFQPHLTLLEIFSWGTWEDYRGTSGLPQLNDAQTLKLRQLTLLTLSASPSFALTYPNLMKSLSLTSVSELESLITTSIYAGLITARLSPTTTPPMVHITSAAPLRDLRPMSLPHLLKVLETWEGRCSSVINEMESQIEGIKTAARKQKLKESTRDEALEAALKDAKAEAKETAPSGMQGQGQGGGRHHGGGSGAAGRRGGAGAGFPVRTAGAGGRQTRGANKRDLEETEDDADDVFEEATEGGGLAEGGMDIDEGAPSGSGYGRFKRRGG